MPTHATTGTLAKTHHKTIATGAQALFLSPILGGGPTRVASSTDACRAPSSLLIQIQNGSPIDVPAGMLEATVSRKGRGARLRS